MRNKMYAYLARRDKKGVKFIGSSPHSSKVYPTKVSESDIPHLSMDQMTSSELLVALKENHMEYELFLETAESFDSLKSSLYSRGYSKIPSTLFSTAFRPKAINEKMLVTKNSTMTRRGSSFR